MDEESQMQTTALRSQESEHTEVLLKKKKILKAIYYTLKGRREMEGLNSGIPFQITLLQV